MFDFESDVVSEVAFIEKIGEENVFFGGAHAEKINFLVEFDLKGAFGPAPSGVATAFELYIVKSTNLVAFGEG